MAKIINVVAIKPREFRCTPNERKMKRARAKFRQIGSSGLPREMPIEKQVYLQTEADKFQQIKNNIQLTVERILSSKN